jgi:hypothetical protein
MKKALLLLCLLTTIILCSCGTDPNNYNGTSGHIDKIATSTVTITLDNITVKYYIAQINGIAINIQSGTTSITIDDGIRIISIDNIGYDGNSISFDWDKENK